jgi:rhodanese-related sulfurtransferase
MSNDRASEPIRISVQEAKERYDEGDVKTLDVVDPGTFEQIDYKIEGAVRIDPRAIDEQYEKLPKEETILSYCT